jgi:nicotinamide mononucleotide transporter PnuC
MLETLTFICVLICVLLIKNENIIGWFFNCLSCILLFLFYKDLDFNFQASLQIFCFIQCLYGLYNWGSGEVKISDINNYFLLIHLILSLIIFFIVMYFLKLDNLIFKLDLLVSILGFLANFYLIKKIAKSWLIFVFFNFITIFIMYLTGNYLMVLLNFMLGLISLNTYFEWKKNLKEV